jgi:cation-transporting ATPase 13A3/4/5
MMLALLISTYLLLDPAPWLYRLMELTYTSSSFKLSMLALAGIGFAASWVGEKFVFPRLAKGVSQLRARMVRGRLTATGEPAGKKRKLYKVILSEGQGLS